MIWFPFYSSDFIGATVGLSCQEVSLYNWMLTLYYELGPFPTDHVRTYRIVRCESDEQKRTVDFLLQNFFILREDGWYQERAEEVKVAVARNSERARAKANKRWNAAPHDAGALQEHNKSNASAMLSTSIAIATSISKATSTSKAIDQKDKGQKNRSPSAPNDVDPQVWEDWKQIRKAKKSPATDTAIKGIRAEAKKAGLSFEDALRISCERGWAGFKAEWVSKQAVGGDKYAAQAERVIKLLDGEIFDAKQ